MMRPVGVAIASGTEMVHLIRGMSGIETEVVSFFKTWTSLWHVLRSDVQPCLTLKF